MKKSVLCAGLLASLLLVGCGKTETPSTSEPSSSKPSTEEPSSSSSSTITTVPAESVTIAGETTVEVGKTLTLTATVAPETTTDKTVTWSSSDDTKATVENGVVTGVAAGKVTIKATCGEKFAEKEIEVKTPVVLPKGCKIEGVKSLEVGKEAQLKATVWSEPTDKTVTWSSSDESIAKIDQTGKLTAIKEGEVTITIVSNALDTIKSSHKVSIIAPVVADESVLLLTEYGEPTKGNNKYIEITNVSDITANLLQYKLAANVNANTNLTYYESFKGTLEPGKSIIVYNSKADNDLVNAIDENAIKISNSQLAFNGDDTIVLIKNDEIVDKIGTNKKEKFAENLVLKRKSTIVSPNATWDKTEWVECEDKTYDNVGKHTITK